MKGRRVRWHETTGEDDSVERDYRRVIRALKREPAQAKAKPGRLVSSLAPPKPARRARGQLVEQYRRV